MKTIIRNAKLILPEQIIDGELLVEHGRIQAVEAHSIGQNFENCRIIDLKGKYLAPGFVELHSHGAGGADFMDNSWQAFETACDTHMHHGTTTLLPTALAASGEDILGCIEAFREAKEKLAGRSLNLYGLHMEGPYLNPEQKGAIDDKYIRDPVPEEFEVFLERGKGLIKRWTLAVELKGALHFADRLCSEGILPSVGHSNAEYSQVLEAFHHGVTHTTHLYSAMSTITRRGGFRHSGVLESAFCIPEMTVEIIADGCHLPPELLRMVWQVKGTDRVALTCDSMRCAGQNVKTSFLGSMDKGVPVIIEDDVAKLTDRSAFAGSIATDDRLVRVMHRQAGVPLAEAVRMMSLTPARIIGLGQTKGSIETGKDADLVCLDEELRVQGVMIGGEIRFGMEESK